MSIFDEYIGQRLKQRYKYIGLKYAREHGFPEPISPSSYGICFKDQENDGKREFIVFRIYFDSEAVYLNGRHVPGRAVKTIKEIELFGEGYTKQEIKKAEKISRGYLERAVETD